MKVSLVKNGTCRLQLQPEDALETAFLAQMAADSEKGATTVLAGPPQGGEAVYTLEVGK